MKWFHVKHRPIVLSVDANAYRSDDGIVVSVWVRVVGGRLQRPHQVHCGYWNPMMPWTEIAGEVDRRWHDTVRLLRDLGHDIHQPSLIGPSASRIRTVIQEAVREQRIVEQEARRGLAL